MLIYWVVWRCFFDLINIDKKGLRYNLCWICWNIKNIKKLYFSYIGLIGGIKKKIIELDICEINLFS